MKRLHVKLIKWISNKFGYKIAMLKASNGTTTVEGNIELLRYVDISGYFFKKEPISRIQASRTPRSAKEMFLAEPVPNIDNVKPINKLTHQQLKELGLTIDVDVTDCKNFKEASKVQDQIINGDVKINIIKNKKSKKHGKI
jgi:hypothetical protein